MKLANKTVIGLTGGIGCGKSTATNFFLEKSIPIIDADKLGHKILEEIKIKNELVFSFGKIILADGEISRKKLGKLVFSDKSKLEKLNEIVHPVLIERIQQRVNSLHNRFVIIDAALLLDWETDNLCDFIVIIKAEYETRVKRLENYKNLSREDAEARIRAQKFDTSKCDFLISNNSTKHEFYSKLEIVWKKIIDYSGG